MLFQYICEQTLCACMSSPTLVRPYMVITDSWLPMAPEASLVTVLPLPYLITFRESTAAGFLAGFLHLYPSTRLRARRTCGAIELLQDYLRGAPTRMGVRADPGGIGPTAQVVLKKLRTLYLSHRRRTPRPAWKVSIVND